MQNAWCREEDRQSQVAWSEISAEELIQPAIDSEVKRLVLEGYDRAKQLLTDHADELEKVAQALLEYETLTGDEIRKVIAGEVIDRPDSAAKLPPLGTGGVSGLPKSGRRRPGIGGVAPQG